MSAFLTALFTILFMALVFIGIGFYLMSRLVGGFGNLRAIYRLFSGKGKSNAHKRTAKTSSSNRSSHTYNNNSKTSGSSSLSEGKVFGDNEGTYVDFEEVK